MRTKRSARDGFEDAVGPKSRKSRSLRPLAPLMMVIALLGIVFAATQSPRHGMRPAMAGAPGIIGLNPINGSIEAPRHYLITDRENDIKAPEGRLRRNEESDRFTVAGSTEIDPKIIRQAKEIDPKMIHDPNLRSNSRPMLVPSKPGPVPSPPMNPIPTDERLRRDR